jgi:hypothetical protein
MMKRLVLLTVVCALGVGSGLAATAGSAPLAPTVSLVACQNIVKVPLQSGGFYFKCVGPYTLGIPHTVKKVGFLLGNKGFAKGSSMTMNLLDAASGRPVAKPLVLGPIQFDPGLWNITFFGPFPRFTMKITITYQGKTLPQQFLFRFT